MNDPYLIEEVLDNPVGPVFSEEVYDLDKDQFSSSMYSTFTIPKRGGGERVILAPNSKLKATQRLIASRLYLNSLKGSGAAHAYYHGRDITTMAAPHLNKKRVLKLDIKDFFPSINPRMVRQSLAKRGVPSDFIKQVIKWCFYRNGLPMGAPTSPVLSNIVAADRIDGRIMSLITRYRTENTARVYRWVGKPNSQELTYSSKKLFLLNSELISGSYKNYEIKETYVGWRAGITCSSSLPLREYSLDYYKVYHSLSEAFAWYRVRRDPILYTRYADDLVLSSDYVWLYDLIPSINSIVKQAGFSLHPDKIKKYSSGSCQHIVGITVNGEKLSKSKKYRRQLRHQLFIMKKDIIDLR